MVPLNAPGAQEESEPIITESKEESIAKIKAAFGNEAEYLTQTDGNPALIATTLQSKTVNPYQYDVKLKGWNNTFSSQVNELLEKGICGPLSFAKLTRPPTPFMRFKGHVLAPILKLEKKMKMPERKAADVWKEQLTEDEKAIFTKGYAFEQNRFKKLVKLYPQLKAKRKVADSSTKKKTNRPTQKSTTPVGGIIGFDVRSNSPIVKGRDDASKQVTRLAYKRDTRGNLQLEQTRYLMFPNKETYIKHRVRRWEKKDINMTLHSNATTFTLPGRWHPMPVDPQVSEQESMDANASSVPASPSAVVDAAASPALDEDIPQPKKQTVQAVPYYADGLSFQVQNLPFGKTSRQSNVPLLLPSEIKTSTVAGPFDENGSNAIRLQDGTFACDICGKSGFNKLGVMKQHRAFHKDKLFICGISSSVVTCHRAYMKSAAFAKHVMEDHPDVRSYPCGFQGCLQVLNSVDELQVHLSTHSVEHHVCRIPTCGRLYNQAENLQMHEASWHDDTLNTANAATSSTPSTPNASGGHTPDKRLKTGDSTFIPVQGGPT